MIKKYTMPAETGKFTLTGNEVTFTQEMTAHFSWQQFTQHYENLSEKSGYKDFLLPCLFLHLYTETQLSFVPRKLLRNTNLTDGDWDKSSVEQKLAVLKAFMEGKEIRFDDANFNTISGRFFNMAQVRNKIVHGHPITKAEAENNSSKLMKLLSCTKFQNFINNEYRSLAHAWNQFLQEIEDSDDLGVAIHENDYLKTIEEFTKPNTETSGH